MNLSAELMKIEAFPTEVGCEVEQNLPTFDSGISLIQSTSSAQALPGVKGIVLEAILQSANAHQRLRPFIQQLQENTSEENRMHLLNLLPSIGDALHKKEGEGGDGIVQLLDCTAALLTDPSNYVREAALTAFDALASYLTPQKQERHLVPVITELLGSDIRIDRVCGLLLLVSLIEKGMTLGGERHLVNWLTQLLVDEDHEVRQELASLYPSIVRAFSKETLTKTVLPHFKFLVKDKMAAVQQAAAEALPILIESLSTDDDPSTVRLQTTVMTYFISLAESTHQAVSLSAKRGLGELLMMLHPSLMSDTLVMTFINLREEPSAEQLYPACAASFITIMKKLGAERWDTMRLLFLAMSSSEDERILKPLASGLHELAVLLPPAVFRRDLQSFLLRLLHEESLSVRAGIAENFVVLLSKMCPEFRELCLHHLSFFIRCESADSHTKNQSYVTHFTQGWRVRASLAQQLRQLTALLDCDLICTYVLPHAFHLCEDSVAHVRLTSAHQLAQLLEATSKQPCTMILDQLEKWQQSPNFKMRSVAALVCQKSYHYPIAKEHAERIHHLIRTLKTDAVDDVRRLV